MSRRYWTFLVVPDDHSGVREYRISGRLIRSFLSFAVLWMVVGIAATAGLFVADSQMQRLPEMASVAEVDSIVQQLNAAHAALVSELESSRGALHSLGQVLDQQRTELARTEQRANELQFIVEGQEDLARTYRTILNERSLMERLGSWFGAFAIGVAATLVGSFMWLRITGRLRPSRETEPDRESVARSSAGALKRVSRH